MELTKHWNPRSLIPEYVPETPASGPVTGSSADLLLCDTEQEVTVSQLFLLYLSLHGTSLAHCHPPRSTCPEPWTAANKKLLVFKIRIEVR